MRAFIAVPLAAAAFLLLTSAAESPPGIFGFTRTSLEAQRHAEARFLQLPSEESARKFHRFLTAQPHVAGSARNKALAEWQREQWTASGLDQVEIVTHDVLLPYPQEVRVEMTQPRAWQASLKEDPIASDPDTQQNPGLVYLAYSASGDVTAPVVYAGSGNPDNYDWLAAQGIDVKGKIALVRYSVPYSYRGFKALTAQQRGLAGLLIYSDPADDGYGKGKTYPDGPWGPESHIQRGGIPFDFLVPGDPLTPGWASTPGARRIEAAESVSIPKIMGVPLSYRDARVILEALGGPEVPAAWRGGLPIQYRAGGSGATVRMVVRNDSEIRQIQTVVGRIKGTDAPDQEIIVGNHRDAWVFGGVDPSSGSATLMELVRSLGVLARDGLRPKRTIVFASWDAEEFTLTSSTEWGEQFADALTRSAVAYVNVDSSASGRRFTASAVPSLNRVIAEVARDIRDPATGKSIAEATQLAAASTERGSLPNATGSELVNNRLGSGSDYTVFLNYLGVPIVDMSFDGPYGVYHSMYDDHRWISAIGDPGFRYHTAMTRIWGVLALRLANADVLPFDYPSYAARLREFALELDKRSAAAFRRDGDAARPLAPVLAAVDRFAEAARDVDARQAKGSAASMAERGELNRILMQAERGFIDPQGIPGRPWYRHQIYAPKFTYAPEIFPGVAEALAAGDEERLREQSERVATAIDRVTRILRGR